MMHYTKVLSLTLLCSLPCLAMETEKQLMAINVTHSETFDLAKTMDLKAAAELEQQKLTILEQEELKLKEAKQAQKQKTDSRLAALQTKVKDARDAARGAEFLRKTLEENLAQAKLQADAKRKALEADAQAKRNALEQEITTENQDLESKIAQAKADQEKHTKTAEECAAVIEKSKTEDASKTVEKKARRFWFF